MLPSSLVTAYNQKAPFDGNAQAAGGLAGNAPALGLDLHRCANLIVAVWDFAVLGGAISTIKLPDDQGNPILFPANTIITRCWFYTVTAPVGASGTLAFGSGAAANDLKTATAITSFTLAAMVEGIPVYSAATNVALSSASSPSITIATTPMTAGKVKAFIEYVLY